jgi:imidazolonepropionase-like amidohydrolase
MKCLSRYLFVIALFSTHVLADTTVFTNVNVVPMTSATVLENQSVVIEDGLIAAIGPVEAVNIPDGAKEIDGKGGYLMPGLADMHIHLYGWDSDPAHLNLYLAQGTTTIRSVAEHPDMLGWREQVRSGELEGPTIYSSGRVIVGNHDNYMGFDLPILALNCALLLTPLLLGGLIWLVWRPARRPRHMLNIAIPLLLISGVGLLLAKPVVFADLMPHLYPEFAHGYLAETPAQAVAEVRRQQQQQVDSVKLYDGLTEETFLAGLAEAKRQGLYVHTHGLDEMELDTLLNSGIDEIVHVDEFNSFHWNKPTNEVVADFVNGIDPELAFKRIPHTVELMARNEIALVSNLTADEVSLQMILNTPAVLARSEYHVVRPEILDIWKTEGRPVTKWIHQANYRTKELPFYYTLIKAMNDAGVVITIGTDTAALVEGTIPANIHRELELLVESGLSNFEALQAGTKNAGAIINRMGRDGNFGTMEIGQRADMLLLKENPLENVSHTRNRVGVMTRGKWYTQEQLDKKVEEYISTF